MPEERRQLLGLLSKHRQTEAQRLFYRLFPDRDAEWTGPSLMGGLVAPGQIIHARDKYPKHLEFFAASATHREICFMAANRVGKTFSGGGYALTCHLTGLYPDWWPGRRFSVPISAWAAGDTYETTRDILQLTLLGEVDYRGARKIVDGRGVIPGDLLGDPVWRQGVQNLVDTIPVRHVSGGSSLLGLKCHPAGTRVAMADGSWAEIQDIRLGDVVLGPDGQPRKVTQLHAYAHAPILLLKTRSGELRATPNHPVMTQRGWVDAGDLVVGDVLEIVTTDRGSARQDDWLVRMTAMMIGDGCSRGKTPFFTCNEPEIVDAVRATLPDDLFVVPVANTISYKVSSSLHKRNRLKESLMQDGLWGLTAHHKFIPGWVFRLPRDQRVEFVRWLWGCDGTVNSKDATYTTASIRLAHDMRLLLWSLGIHAKVSTHIVGNQSGKKFRSYYLALHGDNRVKFTDIGKLNRDSACNVKPRPKGPPGELVEIESLERAGVYCVGVDDVHELVVEGYRVGNSYDQGRRAFQGTGRHVVLFDEEPPMDVYNEALIRTATLDGITMLTFTPLSGLSEVVLSFLPADQRPDLVA